MSDEDDTWWRSCLPCEKCGRSYYFFCEQIVDQYICYGCKRRLAKGRRKSKRGMASNPQHSKPLAPKGYGYAFVPDKMVSPSCTKMYDAWGSRVSCKHAIYRRHHRKRQRRVDQYMIDLELNPNDLH